MARSSCVSPLIFSPTWPVFFLILTVLPAIMWRKMRAYTLTDTHTHSSRHKPPTLKSLFFLPCSLSLCGFNFPNTWALINKENREAFNWKHSWEYQLLLRRTAPIYPSQQHNAQPKPHARASEFFHHEYSLRSWICSGTDIKNVTHVREGCSCRSRLPLSKLLWLYSSKDNYIKVLPVVSHTLQTTKFMSQWK